MHIYGDISRYGRLYIDIEEDGMNSIVKVNNKDTVNKNDIDNKSRKNIAIDLRIKIPELTYHFRQGISINPDEKLEIKVINDDMGNDINLNDIDTIDINGIEIKIQKFKKSYKNVHLTYWKHPYEDMEYRLKEGDRYLSVEESHHVINLIWPMIPPGHTIFSIDVDLITLTEK